MPKPDINSRYTVHFSGTVQGVGFRFTTERLARNFQVTGYVRNLPAGQVEVVAEGSKTEIQRFLAAVEQAMSGYIHQREISEGPGTGEFSGFDIRF